MILDLGLFQEIKLAPCAADLKLLYVAGIPNLVTLSEFQKVLKSGFVKNATSGWRVF